MKALQQDHSEAVEAVDEAFASDQMARVVAQYVAAYDMTPAPDLYGRVLRDVEKPLIEQVLLLTRGNQLKAAMILGLNRNTLRTKIRELGIEVRRG